MHVSFSTSSRALKRLGTLCLLLNFKVSATCYYPNGTADSSHTFLSCKPSGQSMCCQTNTTGTALAPDTCTGDGLCIPPDNNGVWRKLCTDQKWEDPACIGLCITGQDADFSSQNADESVPLTTCGDRSLCCGNIDYGVGQQCCTRRGGFFIENGKLVAAASVSAAPSSAPSSTTKSVQSTSFSNSPPATSSPTLQSKSTSPNTGAIVGGVVGGIAGIVLLGLAFWYFMIRRAIHQRPQSQSYEPYQTAKQQGWQNPSEAPTYASGARRGELDGAARTQELEGWQGDTS